METYSKIGNDIPILNKSRPYKSFTTDDIFSLTFQRDGKVFLENNRGFSGSTKINDPNKIGLKYRFFVSLAINSDMAGVGLQIVNPFHIQCEHQNN